MSMEPDRLKIFSEKVKRALNTDLPGWRAQSKMASLRRLHEGDFLHPPADARPSAVLVLLFPSGGHVHTVFIRRNEYDGIHSGQISFPGGGREESDGSNAATALREAWEETGIDPQQVQVLGELTPLYIPPSRFLVYPVVGIAAHRPDFRPDPTEVQEILEVKVNHFLNPANRQEKEIVLSPAVAVSAPCFVVDNAVIWGATAMMLNELLELFSANDISPVS